MKKVKAINIIGVIIGIAVIVFGLCCISEMGAWRFGASSSPEASFGGDYFTKQYEETRRIVANTDATALNIMSFSCDFAVAAGHAFIIVGILIILHYLKQLCYCTKPKPQQSENN